MTNKDFYELMLADFTDCQKIAKSKGLDYTKGSEDALANFKEGAKYFNVDPKQVCGIFMNKHYQAICNYIKTNGQSESEPISERIKDMINYLVLLHGLIVEEKENSEKYTIKEGDIYNAGKQTIEGISGHGGIDGSQDIPKSQSNF